MATSMQLTFEILTAPDGNIHVQHKVGFNEAEHHVHSPEGYEKWRNSEGKVRPEINIPPDPKPGTCDCGLAPGFIRECNGKTWFNAKFGEDRPKENDGEKAVPSAPEAPKVEVAPPGEADVNAEKGDDEMVTYQATATVGGKKETKEFQHKKASPWAVKRYAASKFFAALVKDMKPLEVWKAIDLKPVRAKKEKPEKKTKKK